MAKGETTVEQPPDRWVEDVRCSWAGRWYAGWAVYACGLCNGGTTNPARHMHQHHRRSLRPGGLYNNGGPFRRPSA